MTDPGTAPKRTQLLQKLVFGAVDGIPQAAMTDPATAPKSKQLLQKLVFGDMDGIPQAANDRSYHSSEKQRIAPKARFRGCGRICHWLLVEFRPQPRRVAFGAILCLSGLWSDLSVSACGIPSTAPKTNFWSNCSLFGTVAGSVIGCLWNSVHSSENELLQHLFAFRGCGIRSDNHALYSLAACGIPSTAPKTSFWSNSLLLGAVVGSDKHVLYSLVAFGIPSTAPKASLSSNSLLFGVVV